jgi:hypothetical protein
MTILQQETAKENHSQDFSAIEPGSALEPSHRTEIIEGSAIDERIAIANFRSIADPDEIAEFLGWKGYRGLPGWIAPYDSNFAQFKPDEPIEFPNGDVAKYLTPKQHKYDAMLLTMPDDPDYWERVEADPSIPIRTIEGVKKAGCSLSHFPDIPAIGLAGVDMGTFGRGGKLVPNLDRFAVPGRPVEICFDSDLYEKSDVREAVKGLPRLNARDASWG